MKVYIAEAGVYAERYIEGVYASAEAAMAANPVSTVDAARERETGGTPGWRKDSEREEWDNGLDYGAAVSVFEFEVSGAEDLALAFEVVKGGHRELGNECGEGACGLCLVESALEKISL